MQPIAFTDEMLDHLTSAAALLPANSRDNFMRSVANRLNDLGYSPGIAELEQAVSFVLSCRGVSTPRTSNKPQDSVAVARTRGDRHFRQGVSR